VSVDVISSSSSRSVRDTLKDIISALIVRSPLIGLLMKRTWVYADESSKFIAYTDGLRIYINPRLFSMLRSEEKAGVLAHEVMHIVLKHVTRAKRVRSLFPHLSQLAVNVVADAKVNHLIMTEFKLPAGAITPHDLANILDMDVEEVEESSFEELCEHLAKKKPTVVISSDRWLELDVFPESSRVGGEEGAQRARGDEDNRKSSSQRDLIVLNEGDAEDASVSSEEEMENRAVRKYVESLTVAKMAGKVPGWAERVMNEILKSKVPWQRLLRAFLTKGIGKKVKRTWSRPSRKHPSFPGKELLKADKVVVLVDTSGSIGEKELQQFISEVYYVAKEVAEVVVIPWDATVYEEQVIRRPDDVKKIKVRGGGGTVIKPALELAHKKYPDNMKVILSDWYISDLDDVKTEQLLRAHADNIIAVTTSATPPSYLKKVVKMEVM